MPAEVVPGMGSMPRRARHLIPLDLPHRREVVAACAVKATAVVSSALPSVAVMVSLACAEVEDSVVVNTPCALVVPVVAPK